MKLTATQTEWLTKASQSAEGALDAPEKPIAAVNTLVKRGLLALAAQGAGPKRLALTQAGRAAIGVQAGQATRGLGPKPSATPADVRDPATQPEPKGKLGALVALLLQPEGASIEAMMQATGWQAHSVRGALSGALKKKLNLPVASEKTAAGRVYRIVRSAPNA